MRWEIGQVGHDRYIGHGRVNPPQRPKQDAVEIRDQRDDQIRPRGLPVLLQHLLEIGRVEADAALECAQHRFRTEGPAAFEDSVIEILRRCTGDAAEHIHRIQQLLKIDELDTPAGILVGNHLLERDGRGAMAAAGVEEEEFERGRGRGHCDRSVRATTRPTC